jgi:hypothetical protein
MTRFGIHLAQSNLDSLSLSFVYPFFGCFVLLSLLRFHHLKRYEFFERLARHMIQLKNSCLMVCSHISKTLLTISYRIVLQLGCVQVQTSLN